ncbi:hypothetical protein AB1L30_05015 [Bremerella sp. JC817]
MLVLGPTSTEQILIGEKIIVTVGDAHTVEIVVSDPREVKDASNASPH